MSCRTNGLVSRFLDFLACPAFTVDTDDIELPRDGICRWSDSMPLILSSCLCRPSDVTLEAQPFGRPRSTCQRDSKVKPLSFPSHLAPMTQPHTSLHCKRTRIYTHILFAFAGTYCAYLRTDGQAELNCSLGEWLHIYRDSPTSAVLSIHWARSRLGVTRINQKNKLAY